MRLLLRSSLTGSPADIPGCSRGRVYGAPL